MRIAGTIALAAGLLGGSLVTDARAERLIASVSNHRVTITPDYSGEQLVLFGSIERDVDTPPNRGNYDLVVTVSGPRMTMITRRKEKRLGIWINTDSREFRMYPPISPCSPIVRSTCSPQPKSSAASSSG
jgi:uncharacterized protein (TIGR02186 family)